MLKLPITYEDFDGEKVTEDFYFNLSKPELLEMEVGHEKGYSAFLKKIVDTTDRKALVEQFKQVILLAYGQKSDDGKRFIKNDQLREEFSQTAAYQHLFMELASDSDAASKFINGLMPKELVAELEKMDLQQKVAANLTAVGDNTSEPEGVPQPPPSA